MLREDYVVKRYKECLFITKNNLSYAISASPDVGFKTYGTCTGRGWNKILVFLSQIYFIVSWGIEKITLCISIAGIQSDFKNPKPYDFHLFYYSTV